MHRTKKIMNHDACGGHNSLTVVFLHHYTPPFVCLFILSLISSGAPLFGKANWPKDSMDLSSQNWVCRCMLPQLASYLSTGDPNSGPHAYVAGILPTKPLPKTQDAYKYNGFLKTMPVHYLLKCLRIRILMSSYSHYLILRYKHVLLIITAK